MTWLARADCAGRLRYAPLQGATAQRTLPPHLLARPDGRPPTVVLLEHGRLRLRSVAAVHALAYLPWPWRALAVLWLVPRPLRDAAYNWVAAHRGRLGPRGQPPALTPAQQARFLA